MSSLNTSGIEADIEELYQDCSRVCHHITTSNDTPLAAEDMEILIKTAIMNYHKQQTPNPSATISSSQSSGSQTHIWNKPYSKFDTELQPEHLYSRHLLNLPESFASAVVLDKIISYANEHLNVQLDVRKLIPSTQEEPNERRENLYRLIRKLFLLSEQDFLIAVERAMEHIDFEILGYVFCEPQASIFFEKCIILEDAMCDVIQMPQSEKAEIFIKRMCLSIANSRKAENLFKQCLKNPVFRESLFIFYNALLQDYEAKRDENLRIYGSIENYLQTDVMYVLFMLLKHSSREASNYLKFNQLGELFSYMSLLFL